MIFNTNIYKNRQGQAAPVVLIGLVMLLAGVTAYALSYYGYSGFKSKNFSAESGLPRPDSTKAAKVLPVTSSDHIVGNIDAPLKIIEFSDTECPFCKKFQPIAVELIKKYVPTGQVAWIYRHFPLNIHPKARKEAEATECAYDQGGEEKFWLYLNTIFAVTDSNNSLPEAKLGEIAKEIGLDEKKFATCLAEGKFANKVDASYKDAVEAGGRGTPYFIFMTADGQIEPLEGGKSFEVMSKIIDYVLNNPSQQPEDSGSESAAE